MRVLQRPPHLASAAVLAAAAAALVVCGAAAALSACGTSGGTRTPAASDARVGVFSRLGPVGTYVSTPWTFSTSSFAIEGPTGLILVDLQFTPSQAKRFVEEAERATGKRAALAVVLHPNPDKFNGTATLQRRGVRVATSRQVSSAIPEVFRQRTAAFGSRYAPDWPSETPAPDAFGDATTELVGGGTRVRAHVLGPGCSAAHVAVEWDGPDGRHLFVGDLIGNGTHAWLELGLAEEWLARLAELRSMGARFVHPGRGASGGPELIDAQERYLRDVLRLVRDERPVMPAPPGAFERLKAKVSALHPGLEFEVFLDLGLPAVWERQARAAY